MLALGQTKRKVTAPLLELMGWLSDPKHPAV